MRLTSTLVVAALAIGLVHASAEAETWPSRQVKIVVPFAAGGAVDVTARIFAQHFQEAWKVPVIVENKAGAGGNIGVDSVAKSPADGYTILLNTNGQAISPATYKVLPWSPSDLQPVTQLLATNLLLVARPDFPAKTLQEFIAYAKEKKGALNYGGTGVGNPLHLTMELLKLRAGIDLTMVPFRSDGEVINALMGRQVDVAIVPVSTGKQQVQTGAIRGLAVTADHRAEGLDLATIAEQGIAGFDAGGWQGLFVPAKSPREAVDRIQQESKKVLAMPEVLKLLSGFAVDPVGSTPEAFSTYYTAEVEKFKTIVREAKIPLQ
jgi:tripartite-type tricarboxylate transporter receptor subunit TctC